MSEKSYVIVKDKSLMSKGKLKKKGDELLEKEFSKGKLEKYLKEGVLVEKSEYEKKKAADDKAAKKKQEPKKDKK